MARWNNSFEAACGLWSGQVPCGPLEHKSTCVRVDPSQGATRPRKQRCLVPSLRVLYTRDSGRSVGTRHFLYGFGIGISE